MPASLVFTLTALSCLAGTVVAQAPAGRAPFRLDVDAARYSGSDSLTYVEVYYGVPEASLTFAPDPGGGFRGAVVMSLMVSDSSGIAASRDWVLPRAVKDTVELSAPRNILSFEQLALRDGVYRVSLVARDSVDRSRADSSEFLLPVSAYAPRAEALSDVELCTRIVPGADTSSPFYRNTLEVLPNPARLYGEGLSTLHFYAEVYNLDKSPGPGVVFRASILDARGGEVAVQSKLKPRAHRSSVEYGSMNISSLPGGSYLFRITLIDTSAGGVRTLDASEKKFFVYRPGGGGAEPAASAPDADRIFSFMTEQEADDEIRKVLYLASEPERRQSEQLPDLASKRNFLRNFWSGRSQAGTDGGGTARAGYLDRIREADRQFSGQGGAGWLSDRGRVWVVYGAPENVERHTSTPESLPYEIWEYPGLQGGVVFIFVDRLGFGTYRLVHSTHINELRNENWYQDEAVIR